MIRKLLLTLLVCLICGPAIAGPKVVLVGIKESDFQALTAQQKQQLKRKFQELLCKDADRRGGAGNPIRHWNRARKISNHSVIAYYAVFKRKQFLKWKFGRRRASYLTKQEIENNWPDNAAKFRAIVDLLNKASFHITVTTNVEGTLAQKGYEPVPPSDG